MKKLLLFASLLVSVTSFAHEEISDLGVVKSVCNHVYLNTSGGTPGYECFNDGVASLLDGNEIDKIIFDMCTKVYLNTSGGDPGYKCFNHGASKLSQHHYRMIKKTCNRVYSNTSGGTPGYKCFRDSFSDMLGNY